MGKRQLLIGLPQCICPSPMPFPWVCSSPSQPQRACHSPELVNPASSDVSIPPHLSLWHLIPFNPVPYFRPSGGILLAFCLIRLLLPGGTFPEFRVNLSSCSVSSVPPPTHQGRPGFHQFACSGSLSCAPSWEDENRHENECNGRAQDGKDMIPHPSVLQGAQELLKVNQIIL